MPLIMPLIAYFTSYYSVWLGVKAYFNINGVLSDNYEKGMALPQVINIELCEIHTSPSYHIFSIYTLSFRNTKENILKSSSICQCSKP